MTSVAILGCGPAGMFAAHAAALSGAEVQIFSKPRKSFMNGAQYLHRPIPGLSGDPFEVEYTLNGTTEGYKSKVYGDTSDVLVSPETLVGIAMAWDIREAYDEAWKLYSDRIRRIELGAQDETTQEILEGIQYGYDLVISTVPADLICANDRHQFWEQKVWATDYIKTPGEFEAEDNLVICSGDPQDWWYRQSRIHGWENTEYPHDRKPNTPEGHLWEVTKPLRTDCDCHPAIFREGRYGRWTKGVLSHESFYNTEARLAGKALVS